MDIDDQRVSDAETMRKSWDARAESDPLYAIDARRRTWEVRDFFSQGPQLVEEIVDPALQILSVDPSKFRVLEIGCGMGRLFEGLSQRFAEVWGIDISERMIEQGRAHCPVEAKWILGDGTSLKGVDSGSIDHVLSYKVFGHVPRPSIIGAYFTEIRRVLRPGGTFQAQLRGGSDSARQAIVRRMPRPFRVVSAAVARRLGALPVQGDIDSWLGCIVSPDEALTMLTSIGFVDAHTFNSDFIGVPQDAAVGYWVVGHKPVGAEGK